MTATASAPLTDRQAQVLLWIGCYLAEHGYSPTVREIAHAHGCNPSGVHGHLRALQTRGCITWMPRQARSIRLTGGAT